MVYVFGTHPVQDFDAWKPVFDSDQARATAAGFQLVHLLRGVENPNLVRIVFAVPSKEAFQAFASDPILAQKMKEAGVLAPPVFEFFTEA